MWREQRIWSQLNISKKYWKRATQFNDIDCGVFALFYVEWCVNKIVVKPSLTNEEIENYSVRLFAITERRKILQKQFASKNRTETETVDLTW